MPPTRFQPSLIKNKIKREEVSRKSKKAKNQQKLQKRLEQAKLEASDPAAKQKRLTENVPRTLDNTREFDASIPLTAGPSSTPDTERAVDIDSDQFQAYFSFSEDHHVPPKVLITTSPKATRATFDFCDELVGVFPGAEYIKRKKGKDFELGRIAGWAASRGYKHLLVVNEDKKKPNAITLVYLPQGPTAYFNLSSVQLTKDIFGHARATPHNPELVLNNFATRLGHSIGRMFQTLFPPLPEFQGRQVVTLHNQRDFLFFRRHRYAFRSTDKVALQEIGPRFTLKLRWLKKGLPHAFNYGDAPKGLEIDAGLTEDIKSTDILTSLTGSEDDLQDEILAKHVPPKDDEYYWMWKPELETTRRTFFL